jgi:hypothetical protein
MKKLLLTLFFVVFNYSLIFAQTATAPSAGDGTSGNPYQIASLNNLYWIASSTANWNKHYIQTANINASATSGWFSGAGWKPIGDWSISQYFTGHYNGKGHTINGLFVNRSSTDNVGLFGFTYGAVIDSLGVTNANITGRHSIGSLVGCTASSTVSNCYATGSVTGINYIGGLVGLNETSSTVSNSYATGSVKGTNYIGGLVGYNEASTVSNSYATGSVKGTDYIGGLVGRNASFSTVNNSYSTGNVTGTGSYVGGLVGYNNSSTVNNSFWDTQTSGRGTSAGGTGKTTAEMKTKSTFTDAGWDATGTIWKIDGTINNGYPFLTWQNPGGTPLPVELTSFTATTHNNSVSLVWQTATEVNNYGFEIERRTISNHQITQSSIDSWQKIGFVAGNGTSNAPKEYSYTDATGSSGSYVYRLKQVDNDGVFKYSQSVEVTTQAPEQFILEQNYPNPFNPSTTFHVALPVAGDVKLVVLNILGQEVAEVVNKHLAAGTYDFSWNAKNLSSGIYFFKLTANQFSSVRKMTLLK